jgi:histidine ammonia-lyase
MLVLGEDPLTCAEVANRSGSALSVQISPAGRARVQASYAAAERAVATRPVYGRTTGVGANRSESVQPSETQAQALLRSHATSSGANRSPERVRALLLVRLNQLCAGGAGLRPEIVDALTAMINTDDLPEVAEHVGIGTADLSALATTALKLQERDQSLRFGPHDALPFMSSNAPAIADAAIGCHRLDTAARGALVVAALSFYCLGGNVEAYAAAVERATPMPGARWICQTMRALLGQPVAARIQDPFGLRALPQAHGVLLDALSSLRLVTEAYLNAPAENPIILPEQELAHHGGFHASYLAVAGDTARIAAVQAGQLSMNRLTYLSEPRHTGQSAFLTDDSPGASGIMVVEYAAAAALGDLRASAMPAAIQTSTLSRAAEDSASFASLASRQLLLAADRFQLLIGAELLAAIRAIRLGAVELPDRLTAAMTLCEDLSSAMIDRDLTEDLDVARRLVPLLAALTVFED